MSVDCFFRRHFVSSFIGLILILTYAQPPLFLKENAFRWPTAAAIYTPSYWVIIDVCMVLYGCETWSLTVREERRLRVFENRVLRRIFGPKRDEETGGWRKLHNEELHNLYYSPSIIRIMK
jgi:hypothetical protein